jgi:hypothetical protein
MAYRQGPEKSLPLVCRGIPYGFDYRYYMHRARGGLSDVGRELPQRQPKPALALQLSAGTSRHFAALQNLVAIGA